MFAMSVRNRSGVLGDQSLPSFSMAYMYVNGGMNQPHQRNAPTRARYTRMQARMSLRLCAYEGSFCNSGQNSFLFFEFVGEGWRT